jgi:DNA-binding protein HU-beta
MNKLELISAVAERTGLAKAKAAEAVEAVFAVIEETLKKEEEVRLVGFGTFTVSTRKASQGRNPRTGEPISLPAARTVRFRVGKTLREAVN